MTQAILLTQGRVARVDDRDYDRTRRFNWTATRSNGRWYAVRKFKRNGKSTTLMLHRFILDVPDGMEVEFVDDNGLNGTRSNMRVVTREQHNWNRRKIANATSKFIGVNWARAKEKWCASIRVSGRLIHLGYFVNEHDAACARDEAAIQYRGRGTRLNFST